MIYPNDKRYVYVLLQLLKFINFEPQTLFQSI